jgi:putative ABC transport system substrate-binding protein
MKRRTLLASLAAASLLGTRFALARSTAKMYRIGLLIAADLEPVLEDLKKNDWELLAPLADLGYVKGRNLTFEVRAFGRDFSKAPQMAAELARLPMDALTTEGTAPTKALQDATRTIPIVTAVNDPVASGFARSLGRPGGNITGLCNQHPDTPAKQVQLLRQLVPGLDRLVIIGEATNTSIKELLRPYEVAARAAGLASEVRLVDSNTIERVFVDMKAARVRAAFILMKDPPPEMGKLAIRHGIATMHSEGYVELGGLMSFSMSQEQPFLRMASIFDKVFRGMDPAEIPWLLPDRSHLAINLVTAKLLGLTVPPDLLLRADQVIR